MGDVMMLIMGFIAGFLCVALGETKVLEDAVHTAYQDGLRDGAEEARESVEREEYDKK